MTKQIRTIRFVGFA